MQSEQIMYPKMLIMRNQPNGMIWQAYKVENEQEERILTKNAQTNRFLVESQPSDYTEETFPDWRLTDGWKSYLEKDKLCISSATN